MESSTRRWPGGSRWSLATTGLDDRQTAKVRAAAATIPLLWAPSMSLAVNLTMKLAELAARALKDRDADVEILERHHRFKEDSPSGTALGFGRIIAGAMGQSVHRHGRQGRTGKRPHGEIGYHAIRVGDNPGEHTVVFGLLGETIELRSRPPIATVTPRAPLGRQVPRRQALRPLRHERRARAGETIRFWILDFGFWILDYGFCFKPKNLKSKIPTETFTQRPCFLQGSNPASAYILRAGKLASSTISKRRCRPARRASHWAWRTICNPQRFPRDAGVTPT